MYLKRHPGKHQALCEKPASVAAKTRTAFRLFSKTDGTCQSFGKQWYIRRHGICQPGIPFLQHRSSIEVISGLHVEHTGVAPVISIFVAPALEDKRDIRLVQTPAKKSDQRNC